MPDSPGLFEKTPVEKELDRLRAALAPRPAEGKGE